MTSYRVIDSTGLANCASLALVNLGGGDMAALIGSMLGGVLGVFLLYSLWEWLVFKRVMNDPLAGKMLSVACAYLTAATLYSLSGSAYGFMPFLTYLPGALIVGLLGWRRGHQLRLSPHVDPELENTFN